MPECRSRLDEPGIDRSLGPRANTEPMERNAPRSEAIADEPSGDAQRSEGPWSGARVAEDPSVRLFLSEKCGLTPTVAELLRRRGFTDPAKLERFLTPKLAHLTPPSGMADRGLAARRLAAAVRHRERVCIFGDYDCDGITATAIMALVLRRWGAVVTPILASRFDGGYGVTGQASERILASGASVLVTCDCGSTDHAALAALGRAGMDVIVIDHHLVPADPLPVLAFLNPNRAECRFPYKGLASCGLAFSLAAAVRTELGIMVDLRPLLELVAVGTIADVVPLDGDNRALVRAGLERLRAPQCAGLAALNERARLGLTSPVTAEDVAFRLAPRLNAPGRMGDPRPALELLLAESTEQARVLAGEIERSTEARRAEQERIMTEAREDIGTRDWGARPGLVLGRKGWNHGVVGVAAGRLAAELERPVAVIGFDASGLGRGSVRGPAGARLHDALRANAHILERYGGHQAAAGLELHWDRLEEFRRGFEAACLRFEPARPALDEPAVHVFPGDVPARIVEDLQRLEPCGVGNPAPRFELEAEVVSARAVRGGHLKVEFELANGTRLAGFGISLGERAAALSGRVGVTGRLKWDRWRGGDAVEIGIEALDARP